MSKNHINRTRLQHSSQPLLQQEQQEGRQRQDSVMQQHLVDKSLMEPYRYINSVPGKDIRGKLIDCFQLWFHVKDIVIEEENAEGEKVVTKVIPVLNEIKAIVADLHNASLLIDDIEDNSKLRRGIPVAHSIFGVAPVINTANYVYFLALQRCFALGNDTAMQVFVKEMLNLHRGQGHDIQWRDTTACPTESQYCSMVIDKTGGLFRLAVGLMQAFATTSTKSNETGNSHVTTKIDYGPLVNNLGLYFQIRDDLINLADEEYFKSKSFCEDLTEGKFSFPIIHCVQSGAKRSPAGEQTATDEAEQEAKEARAAQLLSILKQRTEDVDVKYYAQRLMMDAGSLRYTRQKCVSLKKEIKAQIEALGGNEPLWKLMEMLDVQVEKVGKLDGIRDEAQDGKAENILQNEEKEGNANGCEITGEIFGASSNSGKMSSPRGNKRVLLTGSKVPPMDLDSA